MKGTQEELWSNTHMLYSTDVSPVFEQQLSKLKIIERSRHVQRSDLTLQECIKYCFCSAEL